MLKVGIAGVGFMGWIHYLAYQRLDNIQLAAFCSRDEKKRAGDWTSIKGNFGPQGEQIDVDGLNVYSSYEDMLKDDSLDIIDLCLPPNLHTETTQQAFAAGKHVFCEKPLALTTSDCDALVAAADQAGKQLLVGQVLPFFPEFKHALSVINSGEYGKAIGGSFKRIISEPTWLPGDEFFNPETIGGPMVDLHVHDAHFIRVLFGMPNSVVSRGRMRGDSVEFCQSLFGFEDPNLTVHATCGVVNQQGRPFTHAYEIHLEKATIQFELAAFTDDLEVMPLKILTGDEVIRPDLGGGDDITAFENEITEVVNAIESGNPSPLLSAALARDAISLCHAQTESVKNNQTVQLR